MALDHALAEALGGRDVASGDAYAVLRLYEWSEPTISFGRNEPVRARRRPETGDVRFVRRPTGGRAVLHRGELTYAALLPIEAFGGPRAAYRVLNEALVEGLRVLGVEAGIAVDEPVLRPDAGPCFQAAADGEVVVGGRKLVGSAQARLGGALLQHGSILIEDDQRALGPASTARPLTELVGGIEVAEVRAAIEEGFRRRFAGAAWQAAEHHTAVSEAADRLEWERYGTDAWTWRR